MDNNPTDLFGYSQPVNAATAQQSRKMQANLIKEGIAPELIGRMLRSGFLHFFHRHIVFGDPETRCVLVGWRGQDAKEAPTHSSKSAARPCPTLRGESRVVWIADDPLPALRRISSLPEARQPTLVLCAYGAPLNAATGEVLRAARSIVAWLNSGVSDPTVAAGMWRAQIGDVCGRGQADIEIRIDERGDGRIAR